MKRAAEDLTLLSAEIPSLTPHARARAALTSCCAAVQRGAPAARVGRGSLAVAGWSRRQGIPRARSRADSATTSARVRSAPTCSHAHRPTTLPFPAANWNVHIELALAQAELGKVDTGSRRSRSLLAYHDRYRGPLTLGALHEARHGRYSPMTYGMSPPPYGNRAGIGRPHPHLTRARRCAAVAATSSRWSSLKPRRSRSARRRLELVDRVKVLLQRSGSTLEERGLKCCSWRCCCRAQIRAS